ncbi:metalloproteinase inhibitor 3-like [Anneissia japonica]|uniref:metalloproteinase inhibitor 3-like n=1 Tax=Anneissia japonica TaxID=1529436 RepID=UPI0014258E4F|nr:metalloproteinase inhibitor 3-like [Anneissia japonica]
MTTPLLHLLVIMVSASLVIACHRYIAADSNFYVHKHPQEHYCEADVVVRGRILSSRQVPYNSSNGQLLEDIGDVESLNVTFGHYDVIKMGTIFKVAVRNVYKGFEYVDENSETEVFTTANTNLMSRKKARKTYVLTGFVHRSSIPMEYSHCSWLFERDQNPFVEGYLNFLSGCSWIDEWKRLTPEQRLAISRYYKRNCGCEIVRCHGRQWDPHSYCSGDLKTTANGHGCTMNLVNEIFTLSRQVCVRRKGEPCRWFTVPTKTEQTEQA